MRHEEHELPRLFLVFAAMLVLAALARSAPPPQCTLPPRDDTAADARLTALERRVAELCERLDRPTPSAGGTEAQSVATNFVATPQAAYSAVCGPNGCVAGPAAYPTAWPAGGPFLAQGGGCVGGSCGAPAPAGGLLRGGLFGRRR
jgi:hypothetical protein